MTNDELKLIICGLLGVVFHSLFKLNSLMTDAKKANVNITVNQWLKMDWLGLVLSIISVAIWYLTFKEVANKYQYVKDFARVSFVAMGGMGSFVIQLFFSGTKVWLRKIVDKKTDIADGKNQ